MKILKSLIRKIITVNVNSVGLKDDDRILIANSIIKQFKNLNSDFIQDYEFKVFSQWGDDGIIQFLVKRINISNKTFIEFGIEDYSESNTRFLLMNNNWSGYVIDGSEDNINKLKREDYFWKYDLRAESAFISKENINNLMSGTGFKDIGLLHIDLDGNDYWILNEIDLTVIRPTILIMEYNSVFGKERGITVPYNPDFIRTNSHYSNLYWGASLRSLVLLAQDKGYGFIGCNTNGNNAYFIREDRIENSKLKKLTVEQGYVESRFRESRNKNYKLSFLRGSERYQAIKGLPVFDTEKNCLVEI